MYIKQVIIEGFASYKERCVLNLDRKHTVIMGTNGSGKSNIYKAIEFVLSVSRNSVRCWKYAGEQTLEKLSTFVELVIDNADGVFPINAQELHIKRSLIDANDQYYINGKKYTKHEMVNIFEAAGISTKTNNYIIKEGQITEVARSSDLYKLKLLYEAIGGRQFDESYIQLKNVSNKSDATAKTAVKNMETFEKRRRALEAKTAKLNDQKVLQSEKNSILHYLDEFKKVEILSTIQQLERRQTAMENDGEALLLEVCRVIPKIAQSQRDYKEKNAALELTRRQEEARYYNIQGLTNDRTSLNIRLTELRHDFEEYQRKQEEKQRRDAESEKLREEIKQRKKRFNTVRAVDDEVKERLHQLNLKMEEFKAMRMFLLAKQRRCEMFTSKKGRDADILKRIETLNNIIKNIETSINEQEETNEQLNEKENEYNQQLKVYKKDKNTIKTKLDENYRKFNQLSEELAATKNKMADLIRELRLIFAAFETYTLELPKVELLYHSLVDNTIWEGDKSLKKVIDTYLMSGVNTGYHNQVIDNFTCDPEWYVALESVASGGLFNHIFETKKMVKRILRKIKSLDGGFGYVGLLSLDNIVLPQRITDQNYEMLIEKLTYDPKYTNVMQLHFGNTAIINEITTNNYRTLLETGLNFVTVNGTLLSAKSDYAAANLTQNSIIEVTKRLRTYTIRQKTSQENLSTTLQELATTEKEFQRLEEITWPRIGPLIAQYKATHDKLRHCESALNLNITNRDQLNNHLKLGKQILHGFLYHRNELQQELKTKLTNKLTADEEQHLNVIREEIRLVINEIESTKYEIQELNISQQVKSLSNLIIEARRQEFLDVSEHKDFQAEITRLEDSRLFSEEKLVSVESEVKITSKKAEETVRVLRDLESIVERWSEQKMSSEQKLGTLAIEMTHNSDEITKLKELPELNLAELDVERLYPPNQNAMARYQQMNRHQLNAELKHVVNLLARCVGIDLEAGNQLQLHNESLLDFEKRLGDKQKSNELLETMMSMCEMKKQHVIRTAFDRIASEFGRIFHRLVPDGRAMLDIMEGTENAEMDDNSLTSSLQSGAVYSGVRIRASFGWNEMEKDLIRLSGGQKSVIALAFVLALQTLKPAPFYLLDEVDNALDPGYRAAFVDVMRELAERAQFVTTSFWPEQIRQAELLYQVFSERNASKVRVISLADAEAILGDSSTHN